MERCLAQNKLQKARTEHLSTLSSCSRVLMLGEGPGRLLEVLVEHLPGAEFFIVEQSQQMIFQSKRALQSSNSDLNRITWMHGDALDLSFGTEPFDLVTTPFFLDCFTHAQLCALIPGVANACRPDACWLVADFQIPDSKGLKRARANWIHWMMYLFFHRVTSISAKRWVNPDGLLRAAGFELQFRREMNLGLIRSDLWRRSRESVTMGASTI